MAIGLVFCVLAGIISHTILDWEQWIFILIMMLILCTLVMMSLIPTSYLNEEMMWQIKRLTRIRETYNHIVRDNQLIRANPSSV